MAPAQAVMATLIRLALMAFLVAGGEARATFQGVLPQSDASRTIEQIPMVHYALYGDLPGDLGMAGSARADFNAFSHFGVGRLATGSQRVGRGPGGGTPMPEPSMLGLLGIAFAGFGLVVWLRRRYRGNGARGRSRWIRILFAKSDDAS